MELFIILGLIILVIYLFNVYGRDRNELERKGNKIHLALKNTEELVTLNTKKASSYTRKTK